MLIDAYNNLLLTISGGSQTLCHPNPMINVRISSGQGSAVWRSTVNVQNIRGERANSTQRLKTATL